MNLNKLVSFLVMLSMAALLSGCANQAGNFTFLSQKNNTPKGNYLELATTAEQQHEFASGRQPKHIALLLPMQGKLGGSGQAIRNGFFTAYYYDKKQHSQAPSIQVFDTDNHDIIALYQQALHEGADFVVGPLSKSDVAKLAQLGHLPVPTLALNTVTNAHVDNLYQFGLLPQDEAQQAAWQAWQEHRHSALVIAPNSAWGRDVSKAFIAEWQSLGGQIVEQTYYGQQGSLDNNIKRLLMPNASIVANSKEDVSPSQRRQDFDMIFVVAKPNYARQIQPLLKFYYAGDIPIYATSHVYSGSPQPKFDRDLDGIMFCALPWTLPPGVVQSVSLDNIRHNIMTLWSGAFAQQPQLFALGVDAYNLVPSLNAGKGELTRGINGATGVLFLGSQQQIVRKLPWAQIKEGLPVIIGAE